MADEKSYIYTSTILLATKLDRVLLYYEGNPVNLTWSFETSSCCIIIISDFQRTAVFIEIDTISCTVVKCFITGDSFEWIHVLLVPVVVLELPVFIK